MPRRHTIWPADIAGAVVNQATISPVTKDDREKRRNERNLMTF